MFFLQTLGMYIFSLHKKCKILINISSMSYIQNDPKVSVVFQSENFSFFSKIYSASEKREKILQKYVKRKN